MICDYTELEFGNAYNKIKDYLTTGIEKRDGNISILVCGQPGAGKSSFYKSGPYSFDDYIKIDADEFRRFHPRIEQIGRIDAENYAERTQGFINQITNKLISDLAEENYNLLIEGTLRTAEVPLSTCEKLKSHGHSVNLIYIACDAKTAWDSTISRAQAMIEAGAKPRLVPFDKYDATVHAIPNNIEMLQNANCFSKIELFNRSGEKIVPAPGVPLKEIVEKELNLSRWDNCKSICESDYLQAKMKILQREINEKCL